MRTRGGFLYDVAKIISQNRKFLSEFKAETLRLLLPSWCWVGSCADWTAAVFKSLSHATIIVQYRVLVCLSWVYTGVSNLSFFLYERTSILAAYCITVTHHCSSTLLLQLVQLLLYSVGINFIMQSAQSCNVFRLSQWYSFSGWASTCLYFFSCIFHRNNVNYLSFHPTDTVIMM